MKTIISLPFFFISILIQAQIPNNTSRFVEFMMQDTMSIEADKITYILSFNYSLYNDDEIEDVSKEEIKSRKDLRKKTKELTIKNLIEFANHYQIKFTSIQENLDTDSDYEDLPIGYLEITNMSNLKKQVRELAQIEHIKFGIFEKTSKSETKAMQELIKIIIQKAKEKAAFYAQTMQAKVGKILQVAELHPNISNNPMSGGWVVYPPLSALPHTFSEETSELYIDYDNPSKADTKILLQKSILFRFEIE